MTDGAPSPTTPAGTTPGRAPRFPFSALVGQDDLRRALLVNAVAPDVGGVLVRGERGTAKTTAVRALEPLLPPVPAEPDEGGDRGGATRPAPLVELPVGATVDRVLGTLDLERALRDGEAALRPGLLARADRGILYVDEVNLLPDHLVDVLLDAAAQGEAVVERDGLSVRQPARFMLVGTMNPEEGDLRPQLLDRFGLAVTVAGSTDPAVRTQVVRRRLAFEADPAGYADRWRDEDEATAASLRTARELLPRVVLGDRELALVTGACARLGVDGLRADLVASRCARALAALDGRDAVSGDDVREALLLTLPHRRRRGPLDPPGLEPEELDEALDDAAGDEPEPPDDGGPPPGRPGEDDGSAGDLDEGRGPAARTDAGTPPPDGPANDAGRSADPPSGPDAEAPVGDPPDDGRAPTDDGAPVDAAAPTAEAPEELPHRDDAPARERTDAPNAGPRAAAASNAVGALLALAGRGRDVAGRRGRATGASGQPVDVRPREREGDDLAVAATIRAALLRNATAPASGAAPGAAGALSPTGRTSRPHLRVLPEDHRSTIRAGREGTLVCFCVDASGSMGARRRMAAVKDAALALLVDAYQRRDRVALIAFRGAAAEVVLPPTGSVERAADRLARLPTGGGTPLAAGLDAAATLVTAHRLRDPERRSLCVVVTDGRATGGRAGIAAAERAAGRLGRTADGVVVLDSEQGRVRLGLSARIATAAGARLLPVGVLTGADAAVAA